MNRSKKLIIVSHCILNQNSVVLPYAREMKVFKKFIADKLEENMGILQLPCPEMNLYGLKRWGHVKDQFEHSGFINPCDEEIEKFIDIIKDYKKNGYEIQGIYGIKGSPSCGVSLTCRAIGVVKQVIMRVLKILVLELKWLKRWGFIWNY